MSATKPRRKYRTLGIEDRRKIADGLKIGLTATAIAESIGFSTAAVAREIRLNVPSQQEVWQRFYDADKAQESVLSRQRAGAVHRANTTITNMTTQITAETSEHRTAPAALPGWEQPHE